MDLLGSCPRACPYGNNEPARESPGKQFRVLCLLTSQGHLDRTKRPQPRPALSPVHASESPRNGAAGPMQEGIKRSRPCQVWIHLAEPLRQQVVRGNSHRVPGEEPVLSHTHVGEGSEADRRNTRFFLWISLLTTPQGDAGLQCTDPRTPKTRVGRVTQTPACSSL